MCRYRRSASRLQEVEFGRERGGGWMSGRGHLRRFPPRHDGDVAMTTAIAIPGNTASPFVPQLFGSGLFHDRTQKG